MNLDDAVEDYFRVDDLEVRHQEVMAKVFHLVNIFASGLGGASEGNDGSARTSRAPRLRLGWSTGDADVAESDHDSLFL